MDASTAKMDAAMRADFEAMPPEMKVKMHEMECTREAWAGWIECDNDYARGDRAALEAGALDYLNTIAAVLRKR